MAAPLPGLPAYLSGNRALTTPRYLRAMPSTLPASPASGAPVGDLIRDWRRRRSLSQLELSLESSVSARHLSFLETGRAKPSRELLMKLADHLEVPLRERNELLLAAGYAPLYPARSLESEELRPARQALDRFLRAHEPYPAMVVNRYHELLTANDAMATLTGQVDAKLLEPPANALRIALHPDGLARRTVNLEQWSAYLLSGLRREARVTGDGHLHELYAELAAYPGVSTQVSSEDGAAVGVLAPLRIIDDEGQELAFLSTIATFGTALDVTLAEVSIEAFYPANARTATRLLDAIAVVEDPPPA
jgi:transcriptional regulator with XRE-family HTH domain